jgi:hypothetical protein|eukprot:COSAG02_NODE_67_length_42609_cov_14.506681_42_plen_53_part_00
MDAFFKDREATIDKKARLRAELRAAGEQAGPRQMDRQQQQCVRSAVTSRPSR